MPLLPLRIPSCACVSAIRRQCRFPVYLYGVSFRLLKRLKILWLVNFFRGLAESDFSNQSSSIQCNLWIDVFKELRLSSNEKLSIYQHDRMWLRTGLEGLKPIPEPLQDHRLEVCSSTSSCPVTTNQSLSPCSPSTSCPGSPNLLFYRRQHPLSPIRRF